MASRLVILLPAFNEEVALQRLLPDIALTLLKNGDPFTIVVIDDGSSDRTVTVAKSFPAQYQVHVLSHPGNRGYGAALATGFDWFLKEAAPEDIAVTLDADNTHPPPYIPALVSRLREGADVVTASYKMPGGKAFGVPATRQLMSFGVNLMFRAVYPLGGLTTYTNGFRAYRAGAEARAKETFGGKLITDTGFPGGAELFLKVCRAGGRPAEIPFELHYENRGDDSKINIPRTIRRYLSLIHQAWSIRHS